jgi:hypothetical protein
MYGKALIYEGDKIIIVDENKDVDYSYTVGTTTHDYSVYDIEFSGMYTYRGIKNAAIYTISDTSCANVVDAASRVPESYRKGKLFVRFHNVAPSRWETWINTSSSWTTTESQWVLVGIGEGELDSTVSHGIYLKYAMSSVFDDFTGGGADVVLDESMRPGYVENRALRAIIEPRGGMFIGYDCVGFKNSVSSEYDIASALTPSFGSEYIAYDTETIGSMTGYIGFGTVDKRLDYVMSVLTPITLCSGYDSFTSLKTKAISSGIASLDIYGGVRLCHDSGTTQTMYETQGREISWNPAVEASAMTLSNYYIGEDDNGEALPVIESGKCVNWDNSDTDRVSYRTGNLMGRSHFSFSFTSYSGDFSDGTLRSGEVLSRNVSYSPGITLIHTPNTIMDDKYDIEYTVRLPEGPEKYNADINANLNAGSSLKFTLATDDSYDGKTYTEVNTSGSTEERIITAGMSMRGVFGNKKTKSLSILIMSGDTLSDVSEEISLEMTLPEGYSFNPSEYDFIRKDGLAVDDGELASSGLTFSVHVPPSGVTFGDNDYLIIPTMKLYMEEVNSLMAEGYVLKPGNAYYASSINVERSVRKLPVRRPSQILPVESPELLEPEETWQYTITLTSPLRSGKYIPYEDIESLTSGNTSHTIGEIEYYYVKELTGDNANDATVTYDQRSASFYVTRSLSTGFYLYFKFRNGLKYRVRAFVGLS